MNSNTSQTTPDARTDRRPRRFSGGIERTPLAPANRRVGRFSGGLAQSQRTPAADRIGTFADGLARHPDAPWARRVGSFAHLYHPGHDSDDRSAARAEEGDEIHAIYPVGHAARPWSG